MVAVDVAPLDAGRRRANAAPFVRRGADGQSEVELLVSGARCAGCIAKIERGVRALPGVDEARLNLSTGKLTVTWRGGTVSPDGLIGAVERLGYGAVAFDPAARLDSEREAGRDLVWRLAVAGFAAGNVMLLSVSVWAGLDGDMGEGTRQFFHLLSGLIAVPAALYAGQPFFASALSSLRHGSANMDVPISLAILLSLCLSIVETIVGGRHAYFDAAVTLTFLLLIGRVLDQQLRFRARSAAQDLLAMQAVAVRRIDENGATVAIAARDVVPGDRLLLATGERVPVDGRLAGPETEADLSLVTGETGTVPLARGALLRAGTLITGPASILEASAGVDRSLVAELARLLEAGQQSRARFVRLADRAARVYVPLVHGAAASVFAVWWLLGAGVAPSLTTAIALLIITCPCALGLAVPAVQIVATGRLFRRGVLVKSGDALERLAEIDTVVIDKTGTLTLGRPVLESRESISPVTLETAAMLARASRHPLAVALAMAAGPGVVAEGVREVAGEGLEAIRDGRTMRLGRAAFVGATDDSAAGGSALWFRSGDDAPVRFGFADAPREEARDVIAALAARGLAIELLSGDRVEPVAALAGTLGIATWQAHVSPTEKADRLSALAAEGHRALMIGDGLNDAGALALAHVSAAPRLGADVTQAAADMVLRHDDLMVLVEAIDVARAAKRRVIENFGFAALYNLVAVPVAAFGFVTPLIAALAMSSSSLVVTLNALRLAGRGRRP